MDVHEFLYQELCSQIGEVIADLIRTLPVILPVPERVTLEEIVQFYLLDEEEADLIYLQDQLQDLMVLGHQSEFFQRGLEGLQNPMILESFQNAVFSFF